mmetsp:Transcript_12454/g.23855  ORF Transcript_12454/g.23855 Transcript_12454/m.23855 type:complete len:193 (-) Transcript_12454:113-691(-)
MVYKVLNDTDMRRFYMLLLPQMSAEQQEHCLCCKRKAKGNKFRFSLDASKITKRGNPSYIGKMKESSKGFYEVKLSTNQLVMTIRVAGTEVSAELQHQFLNSVEGGKQGRTIMGNIQTFVQPILALKVESSNRTIFKLSRPYEATKSAKSGDKAIMNPGTFLLDFNYPLTIFLSFAILCAVLDSHPKLAPPR